LFLASTITTQTTALNCIQSCLNQSWINPSGVLALWTFDGTFNDTTTVYNAYPYGNVPSFVSGYIGEAVSFNRTTQQALYTSYIPLSNSTFTIEAWIQPTLIPNSGDSNIFGLCANTSKDYCLQILIRSQKLYFGFYSDSIGGSTNLSINKWIHVAFVFNINTKLQTIYINGISDGTHTATNGLLAYQKNFTIAINSLIGSTSAIFQVKHSFFFANQQIK